MSNIPKSHKNTLFLWLRWVGANALSELVGLGLTVGLTA